MLDETPDAAFELPGEASHLAPLARRRIAIQALMFLTQRFRLQQRLVEDLRAGPDRADLVAAGCHSGKGVIAARQALDRLRECAERPGDLTLADEQPQGAADQRAGEGKAEEESARAWNSAWVSPLIAAISVRPWLTRASMLAWKARRLF